LAGPDLTLEDDRLVGRVPEPVRHLERRERRLAAREHYVVVFAHEQIQPALQNLEALGVGEVEVHRHSARAGRELGPDPRVLAAGLFTGDQEGVPHARDRVLADSGQPRGGTFDFFGLSQHRYPLSLRSGYGTSGGGISVPEFHRHDAPYLGSRAS